MSDILFHNSFLSSCSELAGLLPERVFESGDFIGRGFADLGFEIFIVLSGGKLCSLFTGAQSDLPEQEDARHFFWVPFVDDLIDLLVERGDGPLSCQFDDAQSVWNIANGSFAYSRDASSLHEALLEVAIEIFSNQMTASREV